MRGNSVSLILSPVAVVLLHISFYISNKQVFQILIQELLSAVSPNPSVYIQIYNLLLRENIGKANIYSNIYIFLSLKAANSFLAVSTVIH
jgi:hypothetical protein